MLWYNMEIHFMTVYDLLMQLFFVCSCFQNLFYNVLPKISSIVLVLLFNAAIIAQFLPLTNLLQLCTLRGSTMAAYSFRIYCIVQDFRRYAPTGEGTLQAKIL
ncbi:hypothetical protein FKM82_008563 [Ascaphus truei]